MDSSPTGYFKGHATAPTRGELPVSSHFKLASSSSLCGQALATVRSFMSRKVLTGGKQVPIPRYVFRSDLSQLHCIACSVLLVWACSAPTQRKMRFGLLGMILCVCVMMETAFRLILYAVGGVYDSVLTRRCWWKFSKVSVLLH